MRARLLTGWRQLLAALVLACGHWAILTHAPEEPLHEFERKVTYYWLAATAVALTLAAARIRRPFFEWLRKGFPAVRSRKTIVLGVTAALVLVFLLAHVSPRFRQTQDEVNFVGIAKAMSTTGNSEICFEGNHFDGHLSCDSYLHDPRPKAFPFLLSLGFSLLGDRPALPFVLNTVLFLSCGLLVFRLAVELSARFAGGLFAFAGFSLWPLTLWWARTAGYEMLYLCLGSLLALLAAFLPTLENQGPALEASAGAFTGLIAALLAQTRPEALLLIPLLLLPAVPYLWRRTAPALALVVAAAVAYVPGTCAMRLFHFWALTNFNGGPPPASLNSLAEHFGPNLGVVFNVDGGQPCPRLLTWFGVAGLLLIAGKSLKGRAPRWLALAIVGWLPVQFALVSSGFSANFRMFDQIRYVMTLYPPLSIGAGILAAWLYDKVWPLRLARAPLACALILGFAVSESSLVDSEVPINLLYGPAETNWIVERARTYPANAVFFFSRPQGPLVAGGRASYAYGRLVHRDSDWWSWIVRRSGGELYYVRGYDCRPRPETSTGPDVEPEDRPNCAAIERDYRLKEVESWPIYDAYTVKVSKILGLAN